MINLDKYVKEITMEVEAMGNSWMLMHELVGYIVAKFHDGHFIVNKEDFIKYNYAVMMDELEHAYVITSERVEPLDEA